MRTGNNMMGEVFVFFFNVFFIDVRADGRGRER